MALLRLMAIYWLLLGLAIVLDVIGTVALKLSEGCTQPGPTLTMVGCFFLSLIALAGAVKAIDMSLAYALWAGAGTAVTVVLGILLFNEHVSALKVASVVLIILGIVGLNLSDK